MNVLQDLLASFGVTWPKFIAQTIIFIIVYWVLNKYAFGPIVNVLAERRRRIAEAQENAEKIKQQLAAADARYKEILGQADLEAKALIDEARASAEAVREKRVQEAIGEAEGVIRKAHESIEQDRRKMEAEVKSAMVGLVAAIDGAGRVEDGGVCPTPMRSPREARKNARSLFRGCLTGGRLDATRVRAVAEAVATDQPRGYLGILQVFSRLVRLELERRHAVIESATPLSEAAMKEVRDEITRSHGDDLTFATAVRPDLIGGLRVRVGSDVWDGSVRARLEALPV